MMILSGKIIIKNNREEYGQEVRLWLRRSIVSDEVKYEIAKELGFADGFEPMVAVTAAATS